MNFLIRIFAFILVLLSTHINATVIFNDRNSDLSNDPNNPTLLTDIGVGSFDILGHLSQADHDYLTINLVGSELSSIELTEWSNSYNTDWWITINESTIHYLNQTVVGENILDASFNPTLDTSASTFVIGTRTVSLTLDYGFRITTVVPIPAAAWLFGSALVGLGIIRKK